MKRITVLLISTALIASLQASSVFFEFNKFESSNISNTVTYSQAVKFAESLKEIEENDKTSPYRLIVSSEEEIDFKNASSVADGISGLYVFSYSNKADYKAAKEYYSSLDCVKSVESDEPVKANLCGYNDDSVNDFSMVETNLDDTFKLMKKEFNFRKKLKVAVLDSGCVKNTYTESRISNGYSFIEGYKEDGTDDRHSHGSMVASVILLNTPDSVTVSPYQIFDEDENSRVSYAVSAIYMAVADGCKVINCSFSYSNSEEEPQAFKEAVEYARKQNVTIVAAAGNDGSQMSNAVQYPASFEDVITVGATNAIQLLASFTNWGGNIDFYAPGASIAAYDINGSLTKFSGTSASSPLAAAICADLFCVDDTITAAELEQLLIDTADPVPMYNMNVQFHIENRDDEDFRMTTFPGAQYDNNLVIVDAYEAMCELTGKSLPRAEFDYHLAENNDNSYADLSFECDESTSVYYSTFQSSTSVQEFDIPRLIHKPFKEDTETYSFAYQNGSIVNFGKYKIVTACAYAPDKAKSECIVISAPKYGLENGFVVAKADFNEAFYRPLNRLYNSCLNDETVIIPETINDLTVECIGRYCFAGNENIETIILPESVTFIDDYAFANCKKLKTIIAPGVTYCGQSAFENCTALEKAVIPKILCADVMTFKNCSSLKTLECDILNNVSNGAFENCSVLEFLRVSQHYQIFSNSTFKKCTSLVVDTPKNSMFYRYCKQNSIPIFEEVSSYNCTHDSVSCINSWWGDCDIDGYSNLYVYSCDACDYKYIDYEKHSFKYYGKSYASCAKDESIGYKCIYCNYKYWVPIPGTRIAHELYETVYLEPTSEKTGRATVKCYNCNTEFSDKIIPSLAPYEVKGKITVAEDRYLSSPNNYPLSDARITVNDDLVAITDSNGCFLANFDNGTYTAYVTHPNGFDRTFTFTVNNESITIDEPIAVIACDWHKDGYINAKDFAKLKRRENAEGYDLNGDEIVDSIDEYIFINCISFP